MVHLILNLPATAFQAVTDYHGCHSILDETSRHGFVGQDDVVWPGHSLVITAGGRWKLPDMLNFSDLVRTDVDEFMPALLKSLFPIPRNPRHAAGHQDRTLRYMNNSHGSIFSGGNMSGRNAGPHFATGYGFRDHRTGSHHRAVTNRNSLQNHDIDAQPHVIS